MSNGDLMSTFDIQPKLKLFTKGTCFRTKQELIAHKKAGVTNTDKTLGFDPSIITIPKNTVLIYLEDQQFYSPSKELRQPLSAWVRAKVLTPLGEKLWITLYCDNKVSWDFKTYIGKKNSIINEIQKTIEVLSLSLEHSKQDLIS